MLDIFQRRPKAGLLPPFCGNGHPTLESPWKGLEPPENILRPYLLTKVVIASIKIGRTEGFNYGKYLWSLGLVDSLIRVETKFAGPG